MNRHGQLIGCLALGFVASCVVAVGEPPIDAQVEPGAAHAITHLLDDRHHVATGGAGVIGLVAMVLAWAWLIRLARQNSLRLRWPVAAAVAWTLPVVIGGPVLSSDVYAYGAIGQLVQHGLNPYTNGPSALHSGAFLHAMDPKWAHAHTPYGPLALLFLHAAVWLGHGAFGPTMAILRTSIAVAAVVAVLAAVAAASPSKKALTAAVVAASPLVVVGLVGSAHIDAFAVALAALAALAWRARRVVPAVVLASLAAAVKAPFAVLVVALIVAAVWGAPHGRLRRGGGLVTVAFVAYLVPALAIGRPLQLVSALSTPYERLDLDSPPAALAWLLRKLLEGLGLPGGGVLQAVIFAVSEAIGAVLVVVFVRRSRNANPSVCAGYALAAAALCSPVMHAWYLAWALVLVVPVLWRRDILPWLVGVCGFVMPMEAAHPDLPGVLVATAGFGFAAAAAIFGALVVRASVPRITPRRSTRTPRPGRVVLQRPFVPVLDRPGLIVLFSLLPLRKVAGLPVMKAREK